MRKLVFILNLVFILTVCKSYGLTLIEIRNQVRRDLGDLNVTSAMEKYDDTKLNYLINEAHEDVMEYTWCVIKSTVIDLIADTTYYTLPSDYYVDYRLIYKNVVIPRITIELYDRDEGESWLKTSTGTPINYYIDLENKNVGFLPVPSAEKAVSNAELWYVATPSLTSDSSVPFNGSYKFYYYHRMLVWYVVSEIRAIEGLPNVSYFYNKYQRTLVKMKNKIGITPNYIPSVGYDRDGYRR